MAETIERVMLDHDICPLCGWDFDLPTEPVEMLGQVAHYLAHVAVELTPKQGRPSWQAEVTRADYEQWGGCTVCLHMPRQHYGEGGACVPCSANCQGYIAWRRPDDG